jgi:UDP-MurNAc hydroxylase
MITGDLKSKIDAVWNDFWSGGISNPLEVMEQLTYLLFIKGLDERQIRLWRRTRPIAPGSRYLGTRGLLARPQSCEDLGVIDGVPIGMSAAEATGEMLDYRRAGRASVDRSRRRASSLEVRAMRITGLGHAGLKVETGRSTVLVDPWMSPYGAFQASWFQYPDNQHLLDPSLLEPEAVIVSHEHLDHLDAWFLSQMPGSVPVVIHQYPSPVLRAKLAKCGPRPIVEVGPWEWVQLAGGARVLFVPEDSPMNHDSAVVVVGDDGVLVDVNDARLSPAQLRAVRSEVGGHVDVLTLQAAGASWHPMCYQLPEDTKVALSSQKRTAKLSYARRVIKAVEPVVALPFAGPPCFLDSALFVHNEEMEAGVFPDQQQVVDWLARRGVTGLEVLLPGDTWDTHAATLDAEPIWSGFSFADRRTYLRDYAERRRPALAEVLNRHPDPTTSLWDGFLDHFERLLSMSPYFNSRIGMKVGFEVVGPGGGAWEVDFRPGSEAVHDELDLEGCGYRYRFESRWLPPILRGEVPWEDFLLSLRFQAWREPDVHNEHLLGLLKFAEPQALDAVERYETTAATEERVLVHAEGRTYSVQRLCPHAGADLSEASDILPGAVLRCLNHYYEFDLETGRCLNGACPALDTTRVEDEAARVDRSQTAP